MALGSRIDEATDLPNAADRAISRMQLFSLSQYVEELCRNGGIIDKNLMKLNPSGQKVANANHGKQFQYDQWDGDKGNLALFFAEINMYDIVDNIVKPITKGPGRDGSFPDGCSYVEVVTTFAQPPELFISHYFGQPFAVFMNALNVYMKRHGLPREICFWISSFASRHWSKDQELSSNIDMLPFMCALQCPSVRGTVLITSLDCAALQRIWCLFELNKTLQKRGHRVDIVLGGPGNSNVPIICAKEGASSNTEHIDSDTWDRLLNVHVEQASASKYADKHFLKALIPGPRDFNLSIKQRIAQQALVDMSTKGDAQGIEKLMAVRVDVNAADPNSKEGTALHRAVSSSHLEAVRVLVQNKADVNSQRNSVWQTPLHRAGNGKIVQFLLGKGANPELEDFAGMPAMAPAAVEENKMMAFSAPEPEPTADAAEGTTQQEQEDADSWPTWVPYDELLSVLAANGEVHNHMNTSFEPGYKIRWKGSSKSDVKAASVDTN